MGEQELARRMFYRYRHRIQRRRTAHPCAITKIHRIHKDLLSGIDNFGNKGELLRFAYGGREGRDSLMGESIHIWADGAFKPARLRLIRGKSELLFADGRY